MRLYSAVAKDIAMFAQDHDFNDKRQQENTVHILPSEFDSKIHNRDEHGEPMDELFDPTEVLDDLVRAGWDPKSANASGGLCSTTWPEMEPWNVRQHLKRSYGLEHGANVNATDNCEVTPLHLAAITGFGAVSTLLEFGADRTLRTTSPTDICLYAARGSVTIPAGSTAYELARDSELPEEAIAELI